MLLKHYDYIKLMLHNFHQSECLRHNIKFHIKCYSNIFVDAIGITKLTLMTEWEA